MTILYEFAINVPSPIIIFLGTAVFLTGFVLFIVAYCENEYLPGALTFIALAAIGSIAIVFGIDKKENYAIARIETFTDYEKVNTDNRVVRLLEDNVFLVEIKSKKNNDETSSN